MPVLLYIMLLCTCMVKAQAQDSLYSTGFQLPEKYPEKVAGKLSQFSRHTDQYTGKALDRIIRQEKKMQRKVAKSDSLLAKNLFTYAIDSLQKLKANIVSNLAPLKKFTGSYFPYMDTLKQSLKFLSETKQLRDQARGVRQRLQSSLTSVNGIESKLSGIENFERYISLRQEVLKEKLKQFPQLAGNLKKMNKEAYYYSEQVKQYKEALHDPSKIEAAVLSQVGKLPAFRQLMQRNSRLSGMFASPASLPLTEKGVTIPVVNGLPSRTSVQAFIQANTPSARLTDPVQNITSQLPGMAPQLDQLRNKINGIGGMGNTTMPGFKPNTQHTKSFRKRIEYGTDLQFGKSVRYLPATAALAVKAGYKLNDKSTIGAGGSYMIGLGSGWKNIRFSMQALGLRTYMTWKLHKGLDIQGGSELNYLLNSKNYAQPERPDTWQQSALLGLSKQYAAGKKLKGNIQLLYDFLHATHMPASQPLVFRFGYSLK